MSAVTAMHPPSALELGRMMGLSLKGRSVTSYEGNLDELTIKMREVVQVLRESHESNDNCRAYKEEFHSLYLPSLLRSVIGVYKGKFALVVFHVLLWSIYGYQATVARYIREQPKLVIDLHMGILRMLAVQSSELDKHKMNQDPAHATHIRGGVCMLFETFGDLTLKLMRHLSADVALPAMPTRGQAVLRTVSDKLEDDELLIAEWDSGTRVNIGLCIIINSLLTKHDRPNLEAERRQAIDQGSDGSTTGVMWLHCEAWVQQSEPGMGPCETLGEGTEMDACSRCRAVRYCSRKHQKADWKRHKKFCFQPTW